MSHPVIEYMDFGPPGWQLDTRLLTLLCKKITVAISTEVKPGCNLVESEGNYD